MEATEIAEALQHLSEIPQDQRGPAWHAYLNTLLDQQNRLTNGQATAN